MFFFFFSFPAGASAESTWSSDPLPGKAVSIAPSILNNVFTALRSFETSLVIRFNCTQIKNINILQFQFSRLDKDDLGNISSYISHLILVTTYWRYMTSCWLFIYQQFAQFFPICLYQTSFYWNYSSLRLLSYHQSYESSTSYLSHTSCLICCFWHNRSFYSSWTSSILVWHFFHCSLLDQILFIKRVPSMSIVRTLNHLYSNSFMEFLKDPSLILFFLSYTPLHSVLSYLLQQQTITSMLMILSFCYHSQLWISLITSLTLKIL